MIPLSETRCDDIGLGTFVTDRNKAGPFLLSEGYSYEK